MFLIIDTTILYVSNTTVSIVNLNSTLIFSLSGKLTKNYIKVQRSHFFTIITWRGVKSTDHSKMLFGIEDYTKRKIYRNINELGKKLFHFSPKMHILFLVEKPSSILASIEENVFHPVMVIYNVSYNVWNLIWFIFAVDFSKI